MDQQTPFGMISGIGPFVVNGARQTVADRSAEMKWINGWSTAATFGGEFSSVTRSYAEGRGAYAC
ncbi:hypothetical protein ABIB90_004759 [Bradyrhizobium sp. JR4.1]|uniref:hypothetical protein n=1 Tax=unclassified Bradyrhizobium TaxID=2631580 RepID=UPI00339A363C